MSANLAVSSGCSYALRGCPATTQKPTCCRQSNAHRKHIGGDKTYGALANMSPVSLASTTDTGSSNEEAGFLRQEVLRLVALVNRGGGIKHCSLERTRSKCSLSSSWFRRCCTTLWRSRPRSSGSRSCYRHGSNAGEHCLGPSEDRTRR